MARESYGTPDFARLEIRMTDKAGLAKAASVLRELADNLEQLSRGTLTTPTTNYLAWGIIKSTSQKLRSRT
jgi:hypothetical protein